MCIYETYFYYLYTTYMLYWYVYDKHVGNLYGLCNLLGGYIRWLMRRANLVEVVVGVGGRRVLRAGQHSEVRRIALQSAALAATAAAPAAAPIAALRLLLQRLHIRLQSFHSYLVSTWTVVNIPTLNMINALLADH